MKFIEAVADKPISFYAFELDHIGTWADMYQKFRNEEITEKEYLDWKSQFPAK